MYFLTLFPTIFSIIYNKYMALIYWNKTSLQDQALIWFKDSNKERIEIDYQDKITIIREDNEIVGINIKDASSLFSLKEGAHTIKKEIIEKLKSKFRIDISDLNTSSMFVVGEVLERKPHPKSSKLFILKLLTHKELIIVTNSTNSIVGTKVVLAKLGAILPSGTIIKPAKIMGIASEGMLCGGETLGLAKTEGVFTIDGMKPGEEFNL